MAQEHQLPERIQRDLDEALRHGGVDKLPGSSRRGSRRRFRFPDPRPRNPAELILIAAVLIMAGILIPGLVKGYLIVGGIACGIVAIATHLIQPQGHVRKYWRGRYLDIPTGRWQEKLYRLIYRRQ